jgi:hypothetical protein
MTENLKEEIPVFNNRIFSGRDVLEITLWADVGVIETLNIVKSIEIQQQRGEPQIVRRWDGVAIEGLLTRAEQVLHRAGACLMELAEDRVEVPRHQIENNVAACASAMAAIRSHVNT